MHIIVLLLVIDVDAHSQTITFFSLKTAYKLERVLAERA